MGENLILKMTNIFGEDEVRVMELVDIFERGIDIINNEITTQLDTRTSSMNQLNQALTKDRINNASENKREEELQKILATDMKVKKGFAMIDPENNQDKYIIDFDPKQGDIIIEKKCNMPIIGKRMQPKVVDMEEMKNDR